MKKILIVLTLITLIGLWPFFKKGFFSSHDGEWMIIRFSAFHQTLRGGQFPVRFVDRLNNNYGYPVLNFLYPLPFYFAEIPKLMGFGFVDSIKSVFIASAIISVIAMYWALSQQFSRYASFAGALVYFFAPYRFLDLYVRGSLGEAVAFAFIPLVLGSILKIKKGSKIFIPFLAIFTAGLITSHNVIAVLFLPFFTVVSFLIAKKELLKIIQAFLLGITSAAFFWVPALFDLRYVRLSQIKVSEITDHLVGIGSLIVPSWGYGPSPKGENALSTQVGIVALLIVAVYVFLRIRKKISSPASDFMIACFALIVLLMTEFSEIIWENLPLIDTIQFPWRMLSVIVFISAYLTAEIIDKFKTKKFILSALVVIAAFFTVMPYSSPAQFIDREEGFYSTNESTTNVRQEYLPVWITKEPASRAERKIEVKDGKATLIPSIKPANYKAELEVQEEAIVQVNTIYFPGWKVNVNGLDYPFRYDNPEGLIHFELPKGTYEVIIKYAKTPVHTASELISLASFITAGFLIFKWRKQIS